MTKKTRITQQDLITKFRNLDTTEVYELKKTSDKILWTLLKIKKNFEIEDFIAISVLVAILIEALGTSVTEATVRGALNPLKKKIHSKTIEKELSYKIMQEGISYVEKITQKIKPKEGKSSSKRNRKEREADVRTAIKIVRQMGRQKHLQAGLYYIVLIDLVGSSTASSKMTPEENKKRIKQFIQITKDALPKRTRNNAIFIKKIGDASLFLFSNFRDILDWAKKTEKLCDEYNKKCIKDEKPEIYQMYSKKCVHLGEIHFDEQYDPTALAMNQISKIEKEFKKDQLGITDIVKQVILPRIESGELKATKIKNVKLHGEKELRPLWNIAY